MGRLYPRMRERPPEFRINPGSQLWSGLALAVLGHTPGSIIVKDSGPIGLVGKLVGTIPEDSWRWLEPIKRFGMYFDGVDDYVVFSPTPYWPGAPLSLCAYVTNDYTANNAGAAIVYTHMGGLQQSVWGIRYPDGLFLGDSNKQVYLGGTFVNTIRHVASVADATTQYGYSNGVYKGSALNALSFPGPRTYALGLRGASWAPLWKGLIADVLIFFRIITPSEIAALADPSNVDLRVGGVPLILPPRRRLFTTAVATGPTFNPAWAMHCNTYIGLGRQ